MTLNRIGPILISSNKDNRPGGTRYLKEESQNEIHQSSQRSRVQSQSRHEIHGLRSEPVERPIQLRGRDRPDASQGLEILEPSFPSLGRGTELPDHRPERS